MDIDQQPPLTHLGILVISDDKPGHVTQLEGLTNSLERLRTCTIKTKVLSTKHTSEPLGFNPDIVVGAGHRTHKHILYYAKKYRSFSVVLMKPSFPLRLFDAVICPRHDKIKKKENVLLTHGTINKIRPSSESTLTEPSTNTSSDKANHHVILVGGPSKHFSWEETELFRQINTICNANQKINWLICTSPRTPRSFEKLISTSNITNLKLLSFNQDTKPNLSELLSASRFTWVTPDSQSMVYESITAGCPTGLLELTPSSTKKSRRITQALNQLTEEKYCLKFDDWRLLQSESTERCYPPTPIYFCEADKAANWLLSRYEKTLDDT